MSDDKNTFDGFSKKEENYNCDSCDFTNQSIKGIRTHVTRQHREKDSKKRGRVEDKDDQVSGDVKKSKPDDPLEDAQLLEDIESQSLETLMANARNFEFEDIEDEAGDNKEEEEEETMLPFSLSEKYEESQSLLIDLKTDEEKHVEQINELKRKNVDLEAEIIKRDLAAEQKEQEIYNASCTIAMFKQEVDLRQEEVLKKDGTIETILCEKNLLEEEITDKNRKLDDVEECIKLYGKRLEVMKKKNSKLEEENKSLRKRVSELEASKPTNKGAKKQVEELQESVSKLTLSNRELQLKLTESLNRNAQLETMNARTMLQNKNLSEIANKTSTKAPEAMEVDGEPNSKEKLSTTKAKVEDRKRKKKQCRYFQRGNCTRGDCQFSHPAEVCVVFSRLGEGECSDGNFCDKSHPSQVCERWSEGNCVKGNKCPLQHPGKTGSGSGFQGPSDKRANGNQRRGSQNQGSFPGQNPQNDFKLNYVQQQHSQQDQQYVQQHPPQMPPNSNLYQVPPPQPLNQGPTHGASPLDPGLIGLSGLQVQQVQALLQQQAGPGHQAYQQHQQGGRPRNGGYPGQWN